MGMDEQSAAPRFLVICISRTTGAGGELIGQAVAEQLGFRYVDDQIITRAARQAQVDPELVAAAEHRQPLLQRLLDKLPVVRDLAAPVSLGTGLPLDALAPGSTGYRATADDMRLLIRAAIHEVARAGRAVIVAHAASMALGGAARVLRVLATASPETRAARLAAADGTRTAAAAIAASDRERREYFRTFYGITEELPTHYDLVINTDTLTTERAVALILSVVQGPA